MAWGKWSVSEISRFQSRQTEMGSKVFSGGVLITWMLPRKKLYTDPVVANLVRQFSEKTKWTSVTTYQRDRAAQILETKQRIHEENSMQISSPFEEMIVRLFRGSSFRFW